MSMGVGIFNPALFIGPSSEQRRSEQRHLKVKRDKEECLVPRGPAPRSPRNGAVTAAGETSQPVRRLWRPQGTLQKATLTGINYQAVQGSKGEVWGGAPYMYKVNNPLASTYHIRSPRILVLPQSGI